MDYTQMSETFLRVLLENGTPLERMNAQDALDERAMMALLATTPIDDRPDWAIIADC